MTKISHAEILNWLENHKGDIDIWFSNNSMQWRLRKETLGLFSGKTLSEAVCEAIISSDNRQAESL